MRADAPTTRPLRFVALLGASNIALGLPQLARALDRAGCRRSTFACGHGRSFGLRSSIPLRALGALREAPLFDDPEPLDAALVADVGNDLVYGVESARILAWVEECLERLSARGARIVVAGPPLASLARLTPARYAVAKGVLFPFHALSRDDALRGIAELDAGLAAISARRGLAYVAPPARWYGLDPIHVRRACRQEWANGLVATMLGPDSPPVAAWSAERWSFADWSRLRLLRPESEVLCGIARRGAGRTRLSTGLEVRCQ
jgi:hypothetical protein